MYETHKKGELACCEVYKRALQKDMTVSIPMVESRYDLILDDGKKLWRVQVRYCDTQNSKGSEGYSVKLFSECRNNGYKNSFSREEIDVILAYLPSVDEVIWIGPELFEKNKRYLTVRSVPPKNNQKKGVTMIQDLVW